MRKVKYLISFLLAFFSVQLLAQDIGNFTQFFFNPYSLNPSFAGVDGRGALFLAYKKQWANISGGPTIANLSFHTPLKAGLSFGINVANDQRGLLSNSGALLSFAYSIPLGKESFLRFGLSGGGSWNTIDLDKIQDVTNDPAIGNLLNQNAAITGNAGISLHLKSFHIGFALPNLFSPSYVSQDAFNITEVKPFEAYVIHASNRFYFSNGKHVFEPYVVYRINNGLPSQYEVAGVLHLNHVLWLGGSLKQDFGISAFGGVKINKSFAIGGSYSLKNTGINEINSPSYEVHLSLLGGAKNSRNKKKSSTKPHIQSYSFVDTEIKKLTAKEIAAEKKHQEELAKKKQEEELAKKHAEEERKQAELAKAEEEKKKIEEAKIEEERKQKEAAAIAALALAKEEEKKQQEELLRKQAEEKKNTTPIVQEQKKEPEVVKQPVQQPVVTPERHETFKRGKHPQELPEGNYVIVGVFGSGANAKNLAKKLVDTGFNANYGFLTEKNLWYVHVFVDNDINRVRKERDKYRKMPTLKNAWLLTIEN